MISEKLRNKFKKAGKEKELAEIEEIYEKHEKRFVRRLDPQPQRPKRLFGQNGLNYLQMALRRSKYLMDGILMSIKHNNFLMAVLATRAHFEVTGGVAYLLKKFEGFYDGVIKEEEIDNALFRLIIGSRERGLDKFKEATGLNEIPRPINVLEMIDAIDYQYKKLGGEKSSMNRETYDLLSEFCHPNNYGQQLTNTMEKGVVTYHDSPTFKKSDFDLIAPNLLMSSVGLILFYDKTYRLLQKNEELPIMVR
jgi:hypothetical protein